MNPAGLLRRDLPAGPQEDLRNNDEENGEESGESFYSVQSDTTGASEEGEVSLPASIEYVCKKNVSVRLVLDLVDSVISQSLNWEKREKVLKTVLSMTMTDEMARGLLRPTPGTGAGILKVSSFLASEFDRLRDVVSRECLLGAVSLFVKCLLMAADGISFVIARLRYTQSQEFALVRALTLFCEGSPVRHGSEENTHQPLERDARDVLSRDEVARGDKKAGLVQNSSPKTEESYQALQRHSAKALYLLSSNLEMLTILENILGRQRIQAFAESLFGQKSKYLQLLGARILCQHLRVQGNGSIDPRKLCQLSKDLAEFIKCHPENAKDALLALCRILAMLRAGSFGDLFLVLEGAVDAAVIILKRDDGDEETKSAAESILELQKQVGRRAVQNQTIGRRDPWSKRSDGVHPPPGCRPVMYPVTMKASELELAEPDETLSEPAKVHKPQEKTYRKGDIIINHKKYLLLTPEEGRDVDEVAKHVCAILNTGTGGEILIGVSGNKIQLEGLKLDKRHRDLFRMSFDELLRRIRPFPHTHIDELRFEHLESSWSEQCDRVIIFVKVRPTSLNPFKDISNLYVVKAGAFKESSFIRHKGHTKRVTPALVRSLAAE